MICGGDTNDGCEWVCVPLTYGGIVGMEGAEVDPCIPGGMVMWLRGIVSCR